MSNTVSTEATLFSTTHPDVVKRTSVSSIIISAILCVIGAGAFATSLKMGDSSSTMSMVLMAGGTILFLWAVFRFFWRGKEWVYAPTGSVAKEGTCFFDVCDLQALTDALEKKGFETRNDVKVKTNGNVRMDYMISQDKKFVAASCSVSSPIHTNLHLLCFISREMMQVRLYIAWKQVNFDFL